MSIVFIPTERIRHRSNALRQRLTTRGEPGLRTRVAVSGKAVLFLIAPLIAVVVLSAISSGLLGAVRVAAPKPDAFAAYSAWLGQPTDLLEAHDINCDLTVAGPAPGASSCSFKPDNEPFQLVMLQVALGRVNQVTLFPRAGTLTLGDLVALWGRPAATPHTTATTFEWSRQSVTAAGPRLARPASYHAYIERITLARSRSRSSMQVMMVE